MKKKMEAKTVEERYVPSGEKLGKTSVSVIAAAMGRGANGLCESCLGKGVFGERDFSDFSTPSATPPAVENRSRNVVKTAEDVDVYSLWNNTFLVSDIFLSPVQQKQQHRH